MRAFLFIYLCTILLFKVAIGVITRENEIGDETYGDVGTGAKMDLTVFRPLHIPEGCYQVGYTAVPIHKATGVSVYVLCEPISDETSSLFKKATGFIETWNDRNSGGKLDGSCWQATCDRGYKAIGDVCVLGYVQPDTLYCVDDSQLKTTELGGLIWNDAGSGAQKDGSLWSVGKNGFFKMPRYSHNQPEGPFYDVILTGKLQKLSIKEKHERKK